MRREGLVAVAPLGLRFADAATGEPIRGGLVVSARPAAGGRVTTATGTPGGVYAFHALAGHTRWLKADDPPAWEAAAGFVVTVSDPDERYLPQAFRVTAPGVWVTGGATPETGAVVRLYPGPKQAAPQGFSALRADCFWGPDGRPAAGAAVQMLLPTHEPSKHEVVAEGYADVRGRVAVFFAHKAPPPTADGTGGTFELRFRYGPPAGGWPAAPDPADLFKQTIVSAVADPGTGGKLTAVLPAAGTERVLRTAGRTPAGLELRNT